MPTLLIRADAGGELGSGHVMRMIALAQAWQDRGGVVHLGSASCPERLRERIRGEGISFHFLEDVELGGTHDAERTVELARRVEAAWVVADGYHFNTAFQRSITAAGLQLALMDDFRVSDIWSADLIINQNIDAASYTYDNERPGGRCLKGTKYVLFRRELREAWRKGGLSSPAVPVRKLLITLGGVDPFNVTGKVLDLLREMDLPGLSIRVIVGPANPFAGELADAVSRLSGNAEILTNVRDMAAQYLWADGIISASGGTCYEWLLFSRPGAIIVLADNQKGIARGLAEKGAAVVLGTYEEDFDLDRTALSEWLLNPPGPGAGSKFRLDGQGSLRVVAALRGDPLVLREAGEGDARSVWEWANDAVTRAVSFDSSPIPLEAHLDWWTRVLEDEKWWVRIIESLDGEALGIVRLREDFASSTAVISINLGPAARGRGIGSKAIEMATGMYFSSHPGVEAVLAYAKPDNLPSCAAFTRAGYSEPVPVDYQGHNSVVMTCKSPSS